MLGAAYGLMEARPGPAPAGPGGGAADGDGRGGRQQRAGGVERLGHLGVDRGRLEEVDERVVGFGQRAGEGQIVLADHVKVYHQTGPLMSSSVEELTDTRVDFGVHGSTSLG